MKTNLLLYYQEVIQMKNQRRMRFAILAAVVAILGMSLAPVALRADEPDGKENNSTKQEPLVSGLDYAPHQLVVRSSHASGDMSYLGLESVQSVRRVMSGAPVYLIELDPSADVQAAAAQVSATPSVVYAHPNYLLNVAYSIQGSYPFPDQNVTGSMETQYSAGMMGLNSAHTLATGNGTTVAVIDCGVDFAHPKLGGQAISGWDFVDADANAFDEIDGKISGHGTFVAGIIHLVAPQAAIRSYRVMNQNGYGDGFTVAQAIERAVNDGCDVINLSLALTSRHLAVRDAIDYAVAQGVTVVAGAGNNGTDEAIYPAAEPNALSVGAVDSLMQVTSFSNIGISVDILAPGANIYSSYLTPGFAWWSGTSFSSPFAAGLSALLKQQEPGASTLRIRQRIFGGAVPIDSMNPAMNGKLGKGVLNPVASLNYTAAPDSATFIPDTLWFTHHIGQLYILQPTVSGLLMSTRDPAPFTATVVDSGAGTFCWVDDTAGSSGDTVQIYLSPERFPEGQYYNTLAFNVTEVPDPAYAVVCLTVEGPQPPQGDAWLTPADVYMSAQHDYMSPVSGGSYLSSKNAPALYMVSQRPGIPHVVQIIDTTGFTNDSVRFYFTPSEFFSPGTYEDTLFYSIAGILDPVALAIHITITGDTVVNQSATFSPSNPDYYAAPDRTYTKAVVINSSPSATYSAYVPDSVPWLHLVHASGTTPDSIIFQLVTTGLAPGPYMTYLYANIAGYPANPIKARIRMYVDTPSGIDSAWLTYPTANFTAPGGVPTVTQGQFTVNASGATKGCLAFVSDVRDFIRMQDSLKSTPGVFNFAIEPATTAPGIYVDTVEVFIADVANSPLRFVATLNIGPSSATAWFHAADGDTVFSQASGTVSMRNILVGSSNYPAAYSASLSGAAPFITLTSSTGNTPGTITYRVDTRGVTPGLYSSTLNVAVVGVPDTLSTSLIVNVTPGGPVDSGWLLPTTKQFTAPGGVPTITQDAFSVGKTGSSTPCIAAVKDQRDFVRVIDSVTTAPGQIRFAIEPTTTASGTYVDTIAVYMFPLVNSPLYFVAHLTIDNAGGGTVVVAPNPLAVTVPPATYDTLLRQVMITYPGTSRPLIGIVNGGSFRFVYPRDSAGMTNDSFDLKICPFGQPAGVYTNQVYFHVSGVAGYTTLTVNLTVSASGAQTVSTELSNFPNPFNPSTTISFTLPNAGHATLDVYDLLGRHVLTLFDQSVSAGEHLVVWDGKDRYGASVASGIYFYRLTTEVSSISKKMLLLK